MTVRERVLMCLLALTLGIALALGTAAMERGREVQHQRDLRRHACAELDHHGADADSAEDVAACTFETYDEEG